MRVSFNSCRYQNKLNKLRWILWWRKLICNYLRHNIRHFVLAAICWGIYFMCWSLMRPWISMVTDISGSFGVEMTVMWGVISNDVEIIQGVHRYCCGGVWPYHKSQQDRTHAHESTISSRSLKFAQYSFIFIFTFWRQPLTNKTLGAIWYDLYPMQYKLCGYKIFLTYIITVSNKIILRSAQPTAVAYHISNSTWPFTYEEAMCEFDN